MTDNKSIKVFPCDCGSEGLSVTVEKDNIDGQIEQPYINITFWNNTIKFSNGKLTIRDRFRIIWYAILGILPYTDMVAFNTKVARQFAQYILWITPDKTSKPDFPLGL